jgi:hypothetical protein
MIGTRRPDRTPTRDLVRCASVQASSAQRGMVPLAAVDGSPATDWQPVKIPATLTVQLAQPQSISAATLRWGRMWPPQPKPNVHPPAKPVKTVRPTAYRLMTSTDGTHWREVTHVRTTGSRVKDVLTFPAVSAKYIRVAITASKKQLPPPMLEELTVTH